jgi:hypothetical protein
MIDCVASVTKEFFGRICNSVAYLKCHHFARRVGELKAPMAWLQRFAIDEERRVAQMDERADLAGVEETVS